ncbi:ribosome-inactivating family protein [Nonomuraea jabiensis]|uniref:ribosome-inactivating family protein n=1 Tax=Nonomuraea jabiensis TaxID=882448 RepID=UPI0036CECC84
MDADDVLTGKESLSFGDKHVPSSKRFLAVVEFLRARFATYQAIRPDSDDRNFMSVDIKLSDEQSVQLYFQKQNLYLVGWTINDDPLRYIGVGQKDKPRPASVTRINAEQVIGIQYGSAVDGEQLSRDKMKEALQALYDHLEYKGGGAADKPDTLQKHFDVIARMTSEMARFGGYCDSFQHSWAFSWSQSKPRTVGTSTLGGFNAAVIKWDKLSRKAAGGKDKLVWPGKPVRVISTEDAIAAIGNGVRSRGNTGAS